MRRPSPSPRAARVTAAAVIALIGIAAPLSAQQLQVPAQKQALTIQPISIVVGLYSAEYERAISQSVTLGAGASYWDGFVGDQSSNDDRYLSVDAKLRFYPGEQPLRGFSFGVTGGIARASTQACTLDNLGGCTINRDWRSGPSLGFQLDYNWLLGRRQNFVVALGVGAKRLFVNDHGDDLTLAYPTGRVSIGLAF